MAEDIKPEVKRPEPPGYLPPEAQELWRAVVLDCPPDHFTRRHFEMLEGYIDVALTARWASRQMQQLQAEAMQPGPDGKPQGLDVQMFSYYSEQRKSALTTMAALATKLALTPRSEFRHDARRPKGGKRPWEK